MDSMNAEGGSRPQASWPLLVVAACSFLPGLGFFFAAGAVSWALLSSRPRRRPPLALGVGGGGLSPCGALLRRPRRAARSGAAHSATAYQPGGGDRRLPPEPRGLPGRPARAAARAGRPGRDRKSTRLNSSHI